jgi:Tfp pilus assembly protein FimT
MFSLALLGILLSLGVPAFLNIYERNLLVAETESLLGDLYHARSEAIKRNQTVVICRSKDAASCAPSDRRDADWGIGRMTFVNADSDGIRDHSETLLRVARPTPERVTLRFNHWWRITFGPDGRTGNGTFTLCDRTGNERAVTIYLSGRIRLSKRVPGDGSCPTP